MVESRAAHLAQSETDASSDAEPTKSDGNGDSDLVKLSGKPTKAKKKPSKDRDLF